MNARRSLWKSPALITAIIGAAAYSLGALSLLIQLVGNQFGYGWKWELPGFILFGTLLFVIGLTYELVTRKADPIGYRAAAGVALVAAFFLIWGNFIQATDDINPDAVIYFGVPVVGLIGAVIVRFRPDGMARVLFVTAVAQAVALMIALMIRNPQVTSWTAAVLRGFGGNAFFAVLFVGSALLFRRAARGESAARAG